MVLNLFVYIKLLYILKLGIDGMLKLGKDPEFGMLNEGKDC